MPFQIRKYLFLICRLQQCQQTKQCSVRFLLLSAYDAASHRHWREMLVAGFPEHQWTVLALPSRHFSWRVRGNAMSWALKERDLLSQPFDRAIATSQADLATLRGLVPELAGVHTTVYFHENQFAYPGSGSAHSSVESQITSIYSALAADRLAFNSQYNLNTFLGGAAQLLGRMPDHVPAGIVEMLGAKSHVLPVPLAEASFVPQLRQPDQRLTLVWNHRWEYDKAPDRLYHILKLLRQAGLDFGIHIIGQQFRRQPEAFRRMADEFAEHIGQWGFVQDKADYREVLRSSDIALSTSLHDFQGLAMLEAMAAGCLPVAPRRLAYPEYVPDACLAESFPRDPLKDAESLAGKILQLARQGLPASDAAAQASRRFSWQQLKPGYAQLLGINAQAAPGTVC